MFTAAISVWLIYLRFYIFQAISALTMLMVVASCFICMFIPSFHRVWKGETCFFPNSTIWSFRFAMQKSMPFCLVASIFCLIILLIFLVIGELLFYFNLLKTLPPRNSENVETRTVLLHAAKPHSNKISMTKLYILGCFFVAREARKQELREKVNTSKFSSTNRRLNLTLDRISGHPHKNRSF